MVGLASSGAMDGGRWTFQAEMLLEVAALLNSTLERDQVLGTLAYQFLRIVAADWVVVAELADGDDGELTVVAGTGDKNRPLVGLDGSRLSLQENGFLARALGSREPVWVQSVHGERPEPRLARQLGSSSVLAVPLLFRDTPLGVLAAGWSTPGTAPQPKEMRLIQGLANQAATAMENARLFAASERRAAQVSALFEISRDISANLALKEILSTIVRKARELLGTDTSFLAMVTPDGQGFEMVASDGLRTKAMRELRLGREQGLAGLVVERGEPIIVDDYPREVIFKDPPLEAVREEGLISEIGVPLSDGANLLGVLYIGNRTRVRFSPEDARLLMAFAKQASIAIQNARLYEEAVAQRERAEAGRRHLQVVIDSMPEGVIIAEGADGRITTINRAGKRLLGVDAVEGLDPRREPSALGLFTPEGTLFAVEQLPLQRSVRNGEVCLGVEIVIHRPDGTTLPVLVNSAPFRDLEGRVSGAVVVFQDISKAKEAEQLKDEFMSLVSHELRTPLTSIKGAARTLLRHYSTLDEATRMELLQDVDEEADRLYRLVENLLDFSRAEAGVLRLSTEPVHLGKLASNVVGEMRGRSDRHEFQLDFPPDLPLAEADPLRVEQVLRNLLDNAVKYSPSGGSIEVKGTVSDGMLKVSVRDHGIGISSEDRARVFGRFQRAADARVGRTQGVGLGLAICRRLVEAHGGRIWIEDPPEPCPGSVFAFSLPIVEEEWG